MADEWSEEEENTDNNTNSTVLGCVVVDQGGEEEDRAHDGEGETGEVERGVVKDVVVVAER